MGKKDQSSAEAEIAAQKDLRDAVKHVKERMIPGKEFARDRRTHSDVLARILLEEGNTTGRRFFESGLVSNTAPENIILKISALSKLIQDQRNDDRFDPRVIAILNQFMKGKKGHSDFKHHLQHGIIPLNRVDQYLRFKKKVEEVQK